MAASAIHPSARPPTPLLTPETPCTEGQESASQVLRGTSEDCVMTSRRRRLTCFKVSEANRRICTRRKTAGVQIGSAARENPALPSRTEVERRNRRLWRMHTACRDRGTTLGWARRRRGTAGPGGLPHPDERIPHNSAATICSGLTVRRWEIATSTRCPELVQWVRARL